MLVGLAMLGGCAAMETPVSMNTFEIDRVPMRKADQRDLDAFERGVSLATERDYEAAAGEFVTLIPRFRAAGDERHTAEAIFWAGYCYEKLSQQEAAAEYYHRVVRDHSKTLAATRAKQRLEQWR